MITTAGHYRGPELGGSRIKRTLMATELAIRSIRGPWVGSDDFGPCAARPEDGPYFEVGASPAVNVVFYVPGSLGGFDIPKIEASRFSRKQLLLLVAVPVPPEMVDSEDAAGFVISALHEANRIAAETFTKKGTEPFDFERAEAIVEKVRESLAAQGFS